MTSKNTSSEEENNFKDNFKEIWEKENALICKFYEFDEPEGSTCPLCKTNHTITFKLFKQILLKYCFSKGKVREAIEKTCETGCHESMLKELGL